MSEITGKTHGILKRLHHFYAPDVIDKRLLRFVDIFGRQLEKAETGLYSVLRSHHMETADNLGSHGYTAPPEKRGDLDKIFALYLEFLGGTSQLVQINPCFNISSLDINPLSRLLMEDDNPLISYFKGRFNKKTWGLLERYSVDHAYFKAEEIQPGFALELLLGRSSLSAYIMDHLLPETARQLSAYGGGSVIGRHLKEALANDLNTRILRDNSFFLKNYPARFILNGRSLSKIRRNSSYKKNQIALPENVVKKLEQLKGKEFTKEDEFVDALESVIGKKEAYDFSSVILTHSDQGYFKKIRLSDAVWELAQGIYKDSLNTEYQKEPDPQVRQVLLRELEYAEPVESPHGESLVRLNRMLLDAAFGYDEKKRTWGFPLSGIPSKKEIGCALLEEFNRALTDETLFQPDRFPGMAERYASLQKAYKGDTKWLNRIIIESAFPYTIEKSYEPYRARLQGLIQVLRNGASTRQGIVDIVAANLGIVGNDPVSRKAKARIEIEEFIPRKVSFFSGGLGFYEGFEVYNTNPGQQSPEIWITMLECPVEKIGNIRFIDIDSGKRVNFPGCMQAGDRLIFSGNRVFLNGVEPPEAVRGEVPPISPGISQWRFETDILAADLRLRPAGRFNYPAGTFGTSAFAFKGAVVYVEIISYRYNPGVFTVTIPWHIPGFTDNFAETEDHPRHQILSLVNRVKAAGVKALIAYKQDFQERHEYSDDLAVITAQAELPGEVHNIKDELDIASRHSAEAEHNMEDNLLLCGCFDYTRFDSRNGFG